MAPAARAARRAGITVALALVLIGSATCPAAAADRAEAPSAGPPPWSITVMSSLMAAVIGAVVTLHTTRRALTQGQRHRWQDRSEAAARQAAQRAENELRDRRVANRTAWTPHYQRIDDLLLSAGRIEYEMRGRGLHVDDPEAMELVRARKAAEQYAAYAPGRLPDALSGLADSLGRVHERLLPAVAELNGVAGTRPPVQWHDLFACAAEQARAADALALALKDARAALRHEWGMD
ncbi:hypothetical protein [Streptomyces crystallinus]|uniref:hypothetical protein n=1 Tax=Streptomyces crystallinus TaxID=68191 RepID=UPI0031D9F114